MLFTILLRDFPAERHRTRTCAPPVAPWLMSAGCPRTKLTPAPAEEPSTLPPGASAKPPGKVGWPTRKRDSFWKVLCKGGVTNILCEERAQQLTLGDSWSSTVNPGSACLCLGKPTLPGQTLKGPVVENAGNPARRPALRETSRGRREKQLQGARTLTPGRTADAKEKTIEQTDRSPRVTILRSSPRRPKTGPGRPLFKYIGLLRKIRLIN